jgi:hypothetical protein
MSMNFVNIYIFAPCNIPLPFDFTINCTVYEISKSVLKIRKPTGNFIIIKI